MCSALADRRVAVCVSCRRDTLFAPCVALLAWIGGLTFLACVCAFNGFLLSVQLLYTCLAIASLCNASTSLVEGMGQGRTSENQVTHTQGTRETTKTSISTQCHLPSLATKGIVGKPPQNYGIGMCV